MPVRDSDFRHGEKPTYSAAIAAPATIGIAANSGYLIELRQAVGNTKRIEIVRFELSMIGGVSGVGGRILLTSFRTTGGGGTGVTATRHDPGDPAAQGIASFEALGTSVSQEIFFTASTEPSVDFFYTWSARDEASGRGIILPPASTSTFRIFLSSNGITTSPQIMWSITWTEE